jgi:hypothetical protein
MISVYVSLDCATRTNRNDGHFSTLVSVTEPDFSRGAHITRAMRHAGIAGYHGPYRVVYAHRLDSSPMSVEAIRAGLEALGNPRRRRWLSIVEQATVEETDPRPAPASLQRSRFRRNQRMPGL